MQCQSCGATADKFLTIIQGEKIRKLDLCAKCETTLGIGLTHSKVPELPIDYVRFLESAQSVVNFIFRQPHINQEDINLSPNAPYIRATQILECAIKLINSLKS